MTVLRRRHAKLASEAAAERIKRTKAAVIRHLSKGQFAVIEQMDSVKDLIAADETAQADVDVLSKQGP